MKLDKILSFKGLKGKFFVISFLIFVGAVAIFNGIVLFDEWRDDHRFKMLHYLLWGDFVGFCILCLFVALMQKLIIHPVVELIDLLKRLLSGGDYSIRVEGSAVDELGELYTGFNHLLEQIQLREIGLDMHRRGLENLVQQRTAELAQLSERQQVILDGAGEGIIGLDAAGCHTFVNKAACELLGWPREDLLGRSYEMWRHISKDGSPYVKENCKIFRALHSGNKDFSSDDVFNRVDDACFPVEYTVSPIKQEGKVAGVVVIFRDITARKQAEESINRMKAKLVQSDKMATLGEMATGMAHEINQPLGIIALVSATFRKSMAKKLLTEEKLDNGLKDVEVCVTRMTQTINRVREFSRQGALKTQLVDVTGTIDAALNLLGQQMSMHEIEVVKDFEPGLPRVAGEPNQLEQVWINLITNARDGMLEKDQQIAQGKIMVDGYRKKLLLAATHQKEANRMLVVFTDNGIGISAENKKKVLEPFFTTKEVGKGTGLGLSISYGIIQAHKGAIDIEGQWGEGAVFKVYLPVEQGVKGE